ncbi:T9SS type A sorting domain-containing protein [Flavihumibacter fluvii]|uniref:T9SS type A sorting domain-containing protein n=1 Tax=Flavihumibacter fluvii TaxID=2838157 RepID=UPI001BDE7D9D|nr:T9SS type A sorting domain-containing protein [Flavihumibacter fluvii]ULQ52323.1 T9SS type A sorting domain-containing protein [Flavihumibacter fluvii]
MRRLLHLTFLCLLLSGATMAQNRYWRPASAANLNWNNQNNWAATPAGVPPASVPSVGQTAIFDATNTLGCNLNVASIVVAALQVNTGYTGTITQASNNFGFTVLGDASIAGGTINMRADGLGSFTNIGNFVHGGGTINAAGNLEFDGNFTYDAPAAFNAGTSTVTFDGDNNGFANRTINVNGGASGTLNLYNVVLDKANTGTQNLNIAPNDILNVQNDLSLINGTLGTGTGTVQVGRNLTIESTFLGALVDLTFNGTANSTVIVDAPFKIGGNGSITINKTNPASTVSFTTTLPSNNIILSTAAINSAFNVTSGTVQFPDNDAATINFANLNISAAGTLSAPNNTLTIDGNITAAGTFIPNTGTVDLASTAARTISINGAATPGTLNFYNLTLNNSSANGNINLENLDIINIANNLSINNGRFNIGGAGNATVQVGGNLSTTSIGADATNGNIQLEFTGTNSQTVNFFAGTQGIFNGPVVFNKTGGDITLATPFVLDQAGQTVTFTSGIVNTTSTNILTIGNTTTVSGANNSSYVDGPVQKTGITAFTFPIGDGGFYAPAALSGGTAFGTALISNASNSYVAQYFHQNPDPTYETQTFAPTPPLPPTTKVSTQEYWRIGMSPIDFAAPDASMPYVWLSFENLRSGGITDPTLIGVAAWEAAWQTKSQGFDPAAPNFVRTSTPDGALRQPDPVHTLWTTDSILNPLPVNWLSFTGRHVNSVVELAWTTSSEENNEKFTVERSGDGSKFSAIGEVAGNGTTNLTSYYTFTDQYPLSGIALYRIKQTDVNGKFSYSKEIRVSGSGTSFTGLKLYPNPVNASIPTYLENASWKNQKVQVTIINAIGGVVRKEQISFGGDSRGKISVSGLPKGTYFINTQVNGEKKVVPFVIQ